MKRFIYIAALIAGSLLFGGPPLLAEDGVLVVLVQDAQGIPLANIRLQARSETNEVSSGQTDIAGKARLRWSSTVTPGDQIVLQVSPAKRSEELVFLSPWAGMITLPSFDNEARNFILVVLARRGERRLLTDGNAVKQITQNLLALSSIPNSSKQSPLSQVSELYGLNASELDTAIKAFKSDREPFIQGMTAFYERRYKDAILGLAEAIKHPSKTSDISERDVMKMAQTLAEALYRLRRSSEAVSALQIALDISPNDPGLLNFMGICMAAAGQTPEALRYYQKAANETASILETDKGLSHRGLAYIYLQNYGSSLVANKRFEEAIPVYERLTAIDFAFLTDAAKKAGFLCVRLDQQTEMLAWLYGSMGKWGAADALLNRVLATESLAYPDWDKWLTFDSLIEISIISNDLDRAHQYITQRESLAEGVPSRLARADEQLALISMVQQQFEKSEMYLKAELSLLRPLHGPDYIDIVSAWGNLTTALIKQHKYQEAVQTSRMVLDVDSDSLDIYARNGPVHFPLAQRAEFLRAATISKQSVITKLAEEFDAAGHQELSLQLLGGH